MECNYLPGFDYAKKGQGLSRALRGSQRLSLCHGEINILTSYIHLDKSVRFLHPVHVITPTTLPSTVSPIMQPSIQISRHAVLGRQDNKDQTDYNRRAGSAA